MTAGGRGIDNLVIMFDALDDAVRRYRALGFTVVPGGAHANGTEVALVAFADTTYLQLMAFHTPSPAHRFWKAKEQGGGLIGLCARTDTLAEDVRAIAGAGLPIAPPERGSRVRPDGYQVEWSMASSPPPHLAETAVLVQDHTPRDERIPGERRHANGVTGIAAVTIATDDVARAGRWWGAFLSAHGEPIRRPDLRAVGVRFDAGPQRVELLAPEDPSSPLAEWLRSRGPSPYAAVLTAAPGSPAIDQRAAGARLSLA